LKNLKALLTKPLQDSRLWALWIWNKMITEPEMVKQLNMFIEKGFGGVAIRPSRDISPSYLSEEFYHLFERVLVIAKEKNIRIRIADDFSMPWNGFFQLEAEQNPGYRAQKLQLESSTLITAKDTFQYPVGDKSSCYIIATKVTDGKINPDTMKNLLTGHKGGDLVWKNSAGDWQVMVFKKAWELDPLNYYIPNVFNPKVAHLYIQMVLEKFTARFSKYVPGVFEGFVCEMPAYLPCNNSIPWDDDLIIKYKSRYKKNLVDTFPTLFSDVDDRYAKNRSHVYNFIYQAMFERFPAVLEVWAKKHKFSQWVLCPERNAGWSENILRDVMAVPCANLASAGIQNHEGTEKNLTLIRTMADINSVEYKRETIGVVGRNRLETGATLQSIKTEIDLQASAGVSKLILDGCYFNLDHRSYVKTPYNLFWYHPEWNQMQALCDYAARILSLNRDFTRNSPVAVLMPALSLMTDFLPGNDEALRKGLQTFRKVIDTLRTRSVEFDIVSEQYLTTCAIKPNGEFSHASKIRKAGYLALIVPYSRLINNSTFVYLERLAIKKGTIIFVNEAPAGNFDEGQSPSFTTRVTRVTRPKNENIHVVPLNDLALKLTRFELDLRINVSGKPCPDIYSASGCGKDYAIYSIYNDSAKRDYFATIEFPQADHVYLVDCGNGQTHEIEKVQRTNGYALIELNISPRQTYIIASSAVKVPAQEAGKKEKKQDLYQRETINRNYRVVLKDRWSFSPETFNVLPLASWSARIGLSRDSGGFSHYYEAYFETIEVPEACMLMFCGQLQDQGTLVRTALKEFEVSLNGITVLPCKPKPAAEQTEQDARFSSFCGTATLKYDVREAVMKGLNRVSVRTIGLVDDPAAVMYPPVLAGLFSIKKSARGWTIDTPKTEATYGSWTKNGFPYMSGTGVYEQVFEVPTDYTRIILRLNQVSGTISVEINNTMLGIKNWQPIGYDITDLIEPRRNVLRIRVQNTFDNLLRMNGRASGLIGEAYLDVY